MQTPNEWKTYISNINQSIKGLQALKKIAISRLSENGLKNTSVDEVWISVSKQRV